MFPIPSSEPARQGALDANSGNLLAHDGPAAIVVFLVALPLCIGIAAASGVPVFAGILSGIIGGLAVSLFSGSQVSVTGPAAGLAVVTAAAIQQIGSYPAFLLAVVLAGILQFAFGLMKFGIIADYVPNSVIKGVLAGIGVVIILKQIPHALGRDKDYEGDFNFLEPGGNNTFSEIAAGVMSASPGAIVVFLVCLFLLIGWERMAGRLRLFQFFPGPLAAVIAGIALNQTFGTLAPELQLTDPEHMVNLPVSASIAEFFRQFTKPDFSALANQKVWIAAAAIAVVGSLETLLSLEAADRLDPFKRISPTNRELRAQGIGNFLSGMIGGLPMTSVVVRTSANVYAGARTWMSSFLHGILLLVSVIFIPGALALTPLASLAAILMMVGHKLTKPTLYLTMYRRGWDQFLPFAVTVLAVVLSDLLVGALVGIAIGTFFVIRTNHHEAITVVNQDNNYLLRFTKDASFLNKNEFRGKLRQLPNGANVVIDGTRALFIDHDIMEVVADFQALAPYKNIRVELKHWETYQP